MTPCRKNAPEFLQDLEKSWFDADGCLRVIDPFDAGLFDPENAEKE